MLRKLVLKTRGMFDGCLPDERDLDLWKDIAQFMDGEEAAGADCFDRPGVYVFLGLLNEEKDKELAYMMEQDGMTGVYINDREGFNTDWESGEYSRDVSFCIEKKYAVITGWEEENLNE